MRFVEDQKHALETAHLTLNVFVERRKRHEIFNPNSLVLIDHLLEKGSAQSHPHYPEFGIGLLQRFCQHESHHRLPRSRRADDEDRLQAFVPRGERAFIDERLIGADLQWNRRHLSSWAHPVATASLSSSVFCKYTQKKE